MVSKQELKKLEEDPRNRSVRDTRTSLIGSEVGQWADEESSFNKKKQFNETAVIIPRKELDSLCDKFLCDKEAIQWRWSMKLLK